MKPHAVSRGDGELLSVTTHTPPEVLEAEADRLLADAGFDTAANPLGAGGERVASSCLMQQGRRVCQARNTSDDCHSDSEIVDIIARRNGACPHDEPEATIDAKRAHRVRLERYWREIAKPCASDERRHARIETGLMLLADASSELEIDMIVAAIHRDCKILGLTTAPKLAVALGCSTSAVYTRLKDASLESAIVAIAAEKGQAIAEARRSRRLKVDIRLATKGTVFDSPAWHRQIEKLYASLRYEVVDRLTRETTLSRLDGQKGSDRALRMIPQSRLDLLAELQLLTPEICRMLGKMTEADRDQWLADRDAEDLAELCGDADQRRRASSRYGSQDYERRIKAYLRANGRNPDGPPLPKPNVPAPKRSKKPATSNKSDQHQRVAA